MQTKQLQDFLSELKNTDNQRFDFPIPENVEEHLAECYRHVVERSSGEYIPSSHANQILKSVASWMRKGKSGLLLMGKCGTGKSKVMEAIQLLIQCYTNRKQSLQLISSTRVCELSLSANDDDKETIRRLKTYLYLGLDDLGTETLTVKSWGTELSPVLDTLYSRYDKRMLTILTTNDSLKVLGEKYGERMLDRFIEQYDRVTFEFESFRVKK